MQYGRLDSSIEAMVAESESDALRTAEIGAAVVRTLVMPGRHEASRRGRVNAIADYDGRIDTQFPAWQS